MSILSFIVVFIIVLVAFYITSLIKSYPCKKNMTSIFISNFFNDDYIHIFTNLTGIILIYLVQQNMDFKNFIGLLIFLLIINCIIDTLLHYIIKTSCSIGLSTLLFGFFIYDLLITKKFNYILFLLLIMHIYGLTRVKGVKPETHLIGIITGIASGFIYYKILLKIS